MVLVGLFCCVLCTAGILVYATWTNTVVNDSWSTVRYLYNVRLIYTNDTVVTYSALERNSKIDLLPFEDTRYSYAWRLSGSNTNYIGIQSIETLYEADTTKVVETNGKITTTTITLYQTYLGISDGYFKVEINSGVDMSNNNAALSLNYSYVTEMVDNFNLFNVSPTYGNLVLDHFTIGGNPYYLNDVLHLNTGGADASKLVDKTLTLTAYFKA